MPAKNAFYVTATKILDGQKNAYTYVGTGKVVELQRENILRIIGANASDEDSLAIMTDGTQITFQEELADVHTAVSATNISGS